MSDADFKALDLIKALTDQARMASPVNRKQAYPIYYRGIYCGTVEAWEPPKLTNSITTRSGKTIRKTGRVVDCSQREPRSLLNLDLLKLDRMADSGGGHGLPEFSQGEEPPEVADMRAKLELITGLPPKGIAILDEIELKHGLIWGGLVTAGLIADKLLSKELPVKKR